MYKYENFEMKIGKHNFSNLSLNLNVHFQIGKYVPRGTCTPVCEPLV